MKAERLENTHTYHVYIELLFAFGNATTNLISMFRHAQRKEAKATMKNNFIEAPLICSYYVI